MGSHFLKEFRSDSFADLRQKLALEFGDKDVNYLCESQYVLIDFRVFKDMLHKSNLDQFLLHCLVSSLLQFYPHDAAYWSKESTFF